mgnify:CR=1 FL=1
MENKTVSELKNYCRDNNLSGYSKYTRKQDLMNFINSNINNQQINNQQMITDAEFAQALLNSEKEFYIDQQNKAIQQQRIAHEKERHEMLEKKKKEDDIKNKILQETLEKQNQEYEDALKADLLQKQKEENLQERDKKYAEKISNEDLDKIRLARLARFS